MPESDSSVDEIHIGDRVAYRLSSGEPVLGALGRVIGMFRTQDGQTLADVEWDNLGPPRRLHITNLTKA